MSKKTFQMPFPTLLLASKYALYPPHWRAFSTICTEYAVRGVVIADAPPELPAVHRQLGWIDLETAREEPFAPQIRLLPDTGRRRKHHWLKQTLRAIQPAAIWLQQEPTDPISLAVLRACRREKQPRIVSAVCENIFKPGPPWRRLARRAAWSRLDGLLATSTQSVNGIRQAGMPDSVPATTLVAGMEGPPFDDPQQIQPLELPHDDRCKPFRIGFAGRICEEKGWKVLLNAVASLPPHFHAVLAGSGPQDDELKSWAERPSLLGRVHHVGLLPKQELWRFYRSLDCIAVPSLTFPRWKEQFGGVLADSMAMGLPIIGSDSGAIPEVVGAAGLIVPEGHPQRLAEAVKQLEADPKLAADLGHVARVRFQNEFSIRAYADKIAASLQLSRRAQPFTEAA